MKPLQEQLRRAAKQCQVGVPKHKNAYEDLHSLLADFYSLFHMAAARIEQLEGEVQGLKDDEIERGWE